MSLEFLVLQALNGLSFGALLFLVATGFTLISGVMRIVNTAHGGAVVREATASADQIRQRAGGRLAADLVADQASAAQAGASGAEVE